MGTTARPREALRHATGLAIQPDGPDDSYGEAAAQDSHRERAAQFRGRLLLKGTLRVAAQRGGPHASLSDAQGVTATRASTLLDSKSRLGRCGWLCCCGSNFALFWSLSA